MGNNNTPTTTTTPATAASSHRAAIGRAAIIFAVPPNLPSSLSLPQLGLTPRRDGGSNIRVASVSAQPPTNHQLSVSTSNARLSIPSSSGLTLPSTRSLRNRFNFAKGNNNATTSTTNNGGAGAGVTGPSLKTLFVHVGIRLGFLNVTQTFMDNTEWVERYAYFGVMKNLQGVGHFDAMMDRNGHITPLGEQYIDSKVSAIVDQCESLIQVLSR